jgi:hypothetical protein
MLMAEQSGRLVPIAEAQDFGRAKITGPFDATIVIDPMSRLDLDNGVKLFINTARSYDLIPDDSPNISVR